MDPPDRSELSSDERRALASVLDELIPRSRDGRLPAAGELGLVAHLEATAQRTPGLRPLVAAGLSALDALARARGAREFTALGAAERVAALDELAAAQPAFVPTLVFHSYVGYYQEPRVLEALGLEPRPPHPQGHELEAGDLTLLEPVRRRAKLYRDA